MKFAGISKVSTVDYPGKIVATLFTGGCNFRCDYCHNFDLIEKDESKLYLDENEVFAFLDKRKKVLDGICITGGEPLLWGEELLVFIRKVKDKYGKNFLVKIDTNGSISDLVKKAVEIADFIAIDYKSNYYEKFSGINVSKVLESIRILENSEVNYEVRITMYPEYISEVDFDEIVANLNFVKKVAIQQFNPNKNFVEKDIKPYDKNVINKLESKFMEKGIDVEIRG